jgi:GNAT superfamily N-acetyltransferase
VTITIRQANLYDLQLIHAIRRHAILGISSAALAEADRLEWADSRSPQFFMERVAAGQLLIAMIEEYAAGWGSASGDHITGLYVRPSLALRGVGRRIMASLESQIISDGHISARVESSPNALNFYQKLGYTPVGPPQADRAIPMHKTLRASN